MAESRYRIPTLAIVSKDTAFATRLTDWLTEDGRLRVVLVVAAWGDLLHDAAFPTDLVVLDAASSTRNPVESRVRTIRSSGTAVIVITPPDDPGSALRAVTAGAFCALERTVPAALIAEMGRGAVGLPV